MMPNKLEKPLEIAKEVASSSKEVALKAVSKSRKTIREAVSNKGSVRSSLKGVGQAYLEVGLAAPKALGKLLTLKPGQALSELSGVISGSAKIVGSPVSLVRSSASSAAKKLKAPLSKIAGVKKFPFAVGAAIGSSFNVISSLLPEAKKSPQSNVDSLATPVVTPNIDLPSSPDSSPVSSEPKPTSIPPEKPDLTSKILPGLKKPEAEKEAIEKLSLNTPKA